MHECSSEMEINFLEHVLFEHPTYTRHTSQNTHSITSFPALPCDDNQT